MEELGPVLDAEALGGDPEERPLEDPMGLMGRRDFSILIVDDAPGIRESIRTLVGRLGVFTSCAEAENGLVAYRKVIANRPDLILCDLVMPTVDGLKFLTLLYAKPEFREIPVIVLTGTTDVETKIKGLELGASDYVTKPFDEGELLARIKVQLKIKALQDSLKHVNQQLWELSTVDPLTKLYNRRFFMQALEGEFKRSKRYQVALSFVMVDIDHFKKLNDTYGHQVGDEVLQQVGRIIRESVRTTDTPGRYGGEEFCVLLPHTDPEGGVQLAARLHEAIRSATIRTQSGDLRITVSVGVSCTAGGEVKSPEELIHIADEALYVAKREGRDRVTLGGKAGAEPGAEAKA